MTECKHGHRPSQDDPECFQCRDKSYKDEIAKLREEVEWRRAKMEEYAEIINRHYAEVATKKDTICSLELQDSEMLVAIQSAYNLLKETYCDGAMKGRDFPPELTKLGMILEKRRSYNLCTCMFTGSTPHLHSQHCPQYAEKK